MIQGTIAAAAVINEIIAVIMAKKGFELAGEIPENARRAAPVQRRVPMQLPENCITGSIKSQSRQTPTLAFWLSLVSFLRQFVCLQGGIVRQEGAALFHLILCLLLFPGIGKVRSEGEVGAG